MKVSLQQSNVISRQNLQPFVLHFGSATTSTVSFLPAAPITLTVLFGNPFLSGTFHPSFGTPSQTTATITLEQQQQSVVYRFETPGTMVVMIKYEDPSKTVGK